MKRDHMPQVDARYWVAITCASIFGTNLGDFYAHESGLGIARGLLLLAAFATLAFVAERWDRRAHEVWYWLVIIIIRTGATNIADYLAFRVHVPAVLLAIGLTLLLAALATFSGREIAADRSRRGMPATGSVYWAAMLTAGVFGTVLGDDCSHLIGEGPASLVLLAVLGAMLLARRNGMSGVMLGYWATIAVARTAGTSVGDWLAENRTLDIGLPLATLLTGALFAAVLLLWRSRTNGDVSSGTLAVGSSARG